MAIIATADLKARAAALAYDRLEQGKTYTADELKRLLADAEFELTGGEEVIADPTENVGYSVGDVITEFKDLLSLPKRAILVSPDGEVYRVTSHFGEEVILTYRDFGEVLKAPFAEVQVDRSFPEGAAPTIVWLP